MATTTMQGTQTWNIDSAHSSVDFTIRHMGLFTVRGSLGTVTGTAKTSDGALTSLEIGIDAKGISTKNEQRDEHLKSADFLNVEANPTITYVSTNIKPLGSNEYEVTGNLSLAGQVHPVTLEVEAVPPITDPFGNTRAGATGSGVLHRKDWGITYNSVIESGALLLADEVKFTVDVQAILPKE